MGFRLSLPFGAALALLFLTHCTKQNSENSDVMKVDPASVRSVLVGNTEELDGCSDAVRSLGGKVLYRTEGGSGSLMTNLEAGKLSVPSCKATVESNQTIPLSTPTSSQTETQPKAQKGKEDLSTILRLIPAEEMGARSFIKAHPEFDGRGVTVAVLDTGVEISHPMLTKTSTGLPKLANVQDFSGEGRVKLSAVELGAEGALTIGGNSYSAKGIEATDVKAGIFEGSTLKYSEEVAAEDDFTDVALISYIAGGKRAVRVDTNNDRSFSDEVELLNFQDGQRFSQLGAKRKLNFAVNSSDDGAEVVLHFDDGSHGTHVAGIATGFSDGLIGVAPGAQVISAKIGDNRLAGGSTTTASMMLAIDWAVKQKADVINLSYGIRAGSNLGKSAIDQYIDKVAKESGMLFSISAGNEGPGLLTIGVPAAADLAITNGAYVSTATARDNYGFVNFADDTIWFFSSIGPRLDGGLKPTLLSPGSALSSVPLWGAAKHANYRGTSMASPHTTGGLALLLSAARQAGLLGDRASITRAIYDSAKPVKGLELIEQGHGLMNIPAALERLTAMKASPVEYTIAVNNPVSPSGKGAGIFVRGSKPSENLFTVSVSPLKSAASDLRTLALKSRTGWVKTPGSLWLDGPAVKTFQVALDYSQIPEAGIHSDLVQGVDEATGEIAFEVPVTVVVPEVLDAQNGYQLERSESIRVGQTLRHFIAVPAGATALTVDLSTDGPAVWAQLLDPEGRKLTELRDIESSIPMPALYGQAGVSRGGLFEIDIVGPANNVRAAKINLKVKALSLQVTRSPQNEDGLFELVLENQFAPVKVVPIVEVPLLKSTQTVPIAGNIVNLPFSVSDEDRKRFESIEFTVETSKKLYDLMTDFPFRVFDKAGAMVASGGLELKSPVELASLGDLSGNEFRLEIQGAFTQSAPESWSVTVTERRKLSSAVSVLNGSRLLLESGQFKEITVDTRKVKVEAQGDLRACHVIRLNSPEGKLLQSVELD